MYISYWKNEYDSHFFQRDIFSFSLLPGEHVTAEKMFDLRNDATLPCGLIIGRISIRDIQTLQDAIKAEFEILCPMIDFKLDLQGWPSVKHNAEIRVATLEDSKEVINIASTVFSNTRFHRERTITALANEYHKVWAGNCLNGNQADVVLVSGKTRIDGFIALSYGHQARKAQIVLIGVSPEKQRMGIGKSLLNAGLNWAQKSGASKICVRTEADNGSALSLYLENAFRPIELSVYLRKDNTS